MEGGTKRRIERRSNLIKATLDREETFRKMENDGTLIKPANLGSSFMTGKTEVGTIVQAQFRQPFDPHKQKTLAPRFWIGVDEGVGSTNMYHMPSRIRF